LLFVSSFSFSYPYMYHLSDRVFRENLSPIASEACAIVDQIRFEEQQTTWTKEFEQSLSKGDHAGDIYPGMMFSLAKERMEKTKLWKIVRKMPKGALLHCHFEAMIETSWILEQAFELGNVQIKASKSLDTTENRRYATIFFDVPEVETVSNENGSIWSSGYKPDTFVPLQDAADTFPDGGKAGFIALIISRCTITHEESLAHHEGINDVWRKFTSTFALRHTIIYIRPIFRKYVRRLCKQLHEDNVLWADIRAQMYDKRAGMPKENFAEYVRMFSEEVEAYKASEEGKGFWGLRIIWEALRSFDKRAMITGSSVALLPAIPNPNFQ
jgi:adenosine deaminase CECR1